MYTVLKRQPVEEFMEEHSDFIRKFTSVYIPNDNKDYLASQVEDIKCYMKDIVNYDISEEEESVLSMLSQRNSTWNEFSNCVSLFCDINGKDGVKKENSSDN